MSDKPDITKLLRNKLKKMGKSINEVFELLATVENCDKDRLRFAARLIEQASKEIVNSINPEKAKEKEEAAKPKPKHIFEEPKS